MCVCLCLSTSMWMPLEDTRGHGNPGTGVIGGWEPPDWMLEYKLLTSARSASSLPSWVTLQSFASFQSSFYECHQSHNSCYILINKYQTIKLIVIWNTWSILWVISLWICWIAFLAVTSCATSWSWEALTSLLSSSILNSNCKKNDFQVIFYSCTKQTNDTINTYNANEECKIWILTIPQVPSQALAFKFGLHMVDLEHIKKITINYCIQQLTISFQLCKSATNTY